MYNPLLVQFQNLSEERQVMIWQQLLITPAFTDFLVEAKKSIELQYFNLPEPETFEAADMAKNYAEKNNIKIIRMPATTKIKTSPGTTFIFKKFLILAL